MNLFPDRVPTIKSSCIETGYREYIGMATGKALRSPFSLYVVASAFGCGDGHAMARRMK